MPVAKIMNRGTVQGGEHLAVVASFPVKLMQHVSHIFILSKEQENKTDETNWETGSGITGNARNNQTDCY